MRRFRLLATAVTAVLLLVTVAFVKHLENSTCMGVQIVDGDYFDGYTVTEDASLVPQIIFNGQPAAVDRTTRTVYIPQQIDDDTTADILAGSLQIEGGRYRPFFVDEAAFDDIQTAAQNNHNFTLVAADSSGVCVKFNVVLTTLPVLRMEGVFFDYKSENHERYSGSICLWNPHDTDTDSYTTKEVSALWHKRGNLQQKQSWKISVKDKDGNNENISFAGLGEDDDWIINPLSMDDLKIREKITMDLWQQLMLQVDYPMDMSRGEYVEVVINGQYSGLYMLQRRVDQKYLELEQNNILLKSLDWTSAPSAEQAFEVTYSGLDDATTNGLLQALYDKTIYDKINLENWIDVALYIQMGHLGDNCGHKNMFFLFEMGQDDFEVYLLPWDTDMSFGIGWNGNAGKIEFMYDEMVTSVAKRLEYTELKKLYPDLDKKMAQRWNEMRDGVFSTENIIATAEKYHTFMQATAAYQRDSQVWGLKNGGADSYDRLLEFIQQRMEFLDGHYAKLLQ